MKQKIISVGLLLSFVFTPMVTAETRKTKPVYDVVSKPYVYSFNGDIRPMGKEYQTLEYDKRAYVPIRFVAEALNMKVQYDEKGQVISITAPPRPEVEKLSCPYITSNDKIRALEKRVAELEKENSELKKDIAQQKNSLQKQALDAGLTPKYALLPQYNMDENIRINIREAGFVNGGRDLYLDLQLENVSKYSDGVSLLPTETILSLNGKEYVATVEGVGLPLYNFMNNKDDSLTGGLYFESVSRESKKSECIVKFFYQKEDGTKRSLMIPFKILE
ncbi:MAG: stalk domain-containing protein [Filifactor alocis]|nr:stalk domain-containing protein [Filifactor alocis]